MTSKDGFYIGICENKMYCQNQPKKVIYPIFERPLFLF